MRRAVARYTASRYARPCPCTIIEWLPSLRGLSPRPYTGHATAEQPDVVFTHWPIDNHADHQVIAMLVCGSWLKTKKSSALYDDVSNGGGLHPPHPEPRFPTAARGLNRTDARRPISRTLSRAPRLGYGDEFQTSSSNRSPAAEPRAMNHPSRLVLLVLVAPCQPGLQRGRRGVSEHRIHLCGRSRFRRRGLQWIEAGADAEPRPPGEGRPGLQRRTRHVGDLHPFAVRAVDRRIPLEEERDGSAAGRRQADHRHPAERRSPTC